MTLTRVLAALATLGPDARARVRTLLGPAPPPSLRDALHAARGITNDTRQERLTAALSAGRSPIGPAPSTPRVATVAFTGGK
jgi:hypothetical protein